MGGDPGEAAQTDALTGALTGPNATPAEGVPATGPVAAVGAATTEAATVTTPAAATPGASVADPSGQAQPQAMQPAPVATNPAPTPQATATELRQAVLTVDQDAMFRRSAWGQRAAAELAAESRKVAADNDSAFAALVAAEDELTAARPTLAPEEFRRRAAAFDARVTEVRRERDAARGALNALNERERSLFFQSAAPVMGRVMYARGALVVLDQRTLLISDQSIDATAAIIEALDAELGDGSAILSAAAEMTPPPDDAAPQTPETTPEPPPADTTPQPTHPTPGDAPAAVLPQAPTPAPAANTPQGTQPVDPAPATDPPQQPAASAGATP